MEGSLWIRRGCYICKNLNALLSHRADGKRWASSVTQQNGYSQSPEWIWILPLDQTFTLSREKLWGVLERRPRRQRAFGILMICKLTKKYLDVVTTCPRWGSPTLLVPRTSFVEDSFSTNWEERDGFGMSQGHYIYCTLRASLVAQTVKNLPAKQETQVWSLGWEDLLQKGMTTHSSILAWRISWTEEPGGPQSMGHKESDTIEQLTLISIMITSATPQNIRH